MVDTVHKEIWDGLISAYWNSLANQGVVSEFDADKWLIMVSYFSNYMEEFSRPPKIDQIKEYMEKM